MPIFGQELSRVDDKIDWAAANKVKAENEKKDPKGVEKFRSSKPDAKLMESVKVPILVLGTGPVRANPQIRAFEKSYVASYALNEASLSVLGSATHLPSLDNSNKTVSPPKKSDAPYDFEITEDGADLSFQRFGASYLIRISCRYSNDVRCSDQKFLTSAAEALIVAGGAKK